MEPFSTHTGIAVPLRRTDVDTDQIVPSHFMKRITKTGYDDALFHSWRQDPKFILNREPYDHGSILVAGVNFGTGSSREHAVWALRDFGFKVVISPRFADIFRSNARNQGLLAAQVEPDVVETLWDRLDADPGMELSVDLEHRRLFAGEDEWPFDIDDNARWMLMEGLDAIAVTLEQVGAITAFEQRRPAWMPTTTPLTER